MFSLKDVQKAVPIPVMREAYRILSQNQINDIRYTTAEYPKIKLSGAVMGKRLRFINATVNYETGEIVSTFCTCTSISRICEHTAALLIVFASALDDGRIRITKPHRPTSAAILEMMTDNSDYAAFAEPDTSGSYTLEYIADMEESFRDNSLSVTFRCGRKNEKKYVVKSIHELLDSMENRTEYEFGKKKKATLCMESFDEPSQKMLAFLSSIDNKENRFKRTNSYYGYYRSDPDLYRQRLGKVLELKGVFLDRFFEAADEAGFFMKREGEKLSDLTDHVYFDPEVRKVPISLSRQNDGFAMHMGNTEYWLEGAAWIYIFEELNDSFYRLPYSSRFAQLLDIDRYGDELYIAEEDMKQFAGLLTNAFSDVADIRHTGFELEKYVPLKPVFRIYLDMPQQDLITGTLKAVYGEHEYNILNDRDKNKDADIRNRFEEEKMIRFFSGFFNSFDNENSRYGIFGDDEVLYRLLTEGIEAMTKKAEVFISDALKKLQVKSVNKVQLGVSVSHDLLELHMDSEDLNYDELAQILSRYNPKKKFYRLKNGQFIRADENIDEIADLASELGLKPSDVRKGNLTVPQYRALLLNDEAERGYPIDRDAHFRDLITNIRGTSEREYEIPASLQEVLRDYQKEGFRWLSALYDNGFAALLADEMGLGKTLQIISFLLARREEGKALVVCPASLVYNWKNEFERFAPQLRVTMSTGTAAQREEVLKDLQESDVVITSYGLIGRDAALFEDIHFTFEIIDEAQAIKNANTLAAHAVKSVHAKFRIALTGTPIENRLSELWSIFDYLMPGFLYSYKYFRSEYETPIVKGEESELREKLRKMIAPFILRRMKKDVLKDLPPKMEEVYYASLTGEQKQLYEARLKLLRASVSKQSDQEFNENKLRVLAELMRLRQLCCAPSLVYEGYRGNSEKEDMCIDLIRSAIDEGHKILLFSQFTSMLDILMERLKAESIAYHVLTGSTPKQKRIELVDQFQNDDIPVFCISMKAGGTGLNLTAADIVIHYDPWWNTAAENQASDRTHRIGQENPVTVYRLIMKDSVEERILSLQQSKADLAESILSGDEMSRASFTKDELLDILR